MVEIKEIESKIHKTIEILADNYIKFLQELVRTPSIYGDEGKCLSIIENKMRSLGIFNEKIYYEKENDPCLIAKIRGTGDGRTFILNAHIDTAPVENSHSWDHHPFSAQIVDGKIYGRGTLDDKAGLAIMLMIAEALLLNEIKFDGDLLLECVSGDENSGNGSLACLESGYFCDAAIIIDGTWPFRIIDGHLGQIWLTINISGTPSAACSLDRALNPIIGAFGVIQNIQGLIDTWNNSNPKWLDIDNPHFFNVGSINGGKWAGAVPESCKMQIQIGFAPPLNFEEVIKAIEDTLSSVKHYKINISIDSLCHNPFSNKENKLVNLLKDVIIGLRNDEYPLKRTTVKGHCDLRYMKRKDGTVADACLYGPGGGGNPHCNNEYYIIEHFIPVAQNIASTLIRYYNL
jgi:acetylornithine deacetylase